MKKGQTEVLTMERSIYGPSDDLAKGNLPNRTSLHESSTRLVSDPPTQNSTVSETNSLLGERYIKHNEIKLTKEGFVVQV